ncbi:hypothetical protein K7432_015293 [Basidiobolus ranarum]|uniref:Uncharacterized protein n=1 Tax=Basidiobolus ranarum TaxID=34480 RepID=A0ABR2WGC7_9FUNG
MTILFSIITLLSANLLLGTYGSSVGNILDPDIQVDYDSSTNYFPDQIKFDTKAVFTVEYQLSYKYIYNKVTNQTFVLYQRGTPKPMPRSLHATFFEVPLNKVGIITSTAIPYMEMLGLRERIAYTTLTDSPCIRKLQREEKIASFPSDFLNSMNKILQLPNFCNERISSNTIQNVHEVSDILESTGWVGFYATFFNMEKTANTVVEAIINNYNCIKKSAMKKTKKHRPVVAWAGLFSYQNVTYYGVSSAINKFNLTIDAGATMIDMKSIDVPELKRDNDRHTLKQGDERKIFAYKTAADIQKVLKDVDVLIDETYTHTYTNRSIYAPTFKDVLKQYGLTESDTQFKFIKNKAIFRTDRIQSWWSNSGWKFGSVNMPDAALEDVINAIHPGFHRQYVFHWMRNVYSDNKVSRAWAGECKNPKSQQPSLARTCNLHGSRDTTSLRSLGALARLITQWY